MGILKSDLKKMNDLIEKGTTIADVQRKFHQYDYWEIYWEINDYSFLGKKRMITNRINKIVKSKSSSERLKIADEAKSLIDELYSQLKTNSKKLIRIDRILREKD